MIRKEKERERKHSFHREQKSTEVFYCNIRLVGTGSLEFHSSLHTGKRLICQSRQMGVLISKLVDHVIESI